MSNTMVTFKVSYNGDMHRFSISEQDATIDKLNNFIMEAFELNDMSKFKKKYEDPEGDLITLKTNFDLQEAIRIALSTKKVIRLRLVYDQYNIDSEDYEQIETNKPNEDANKIIESSISNEIENKNESVTDFEKQSDNNSNDSQDISDNSVESSCDSTVDTSDPLDSFMYNLGKTSLLDIEETLEKSQKAVESILDALFGPSPNKREFRSPENKQNRFKRVFNNDLRSNSENASNKPSENREKPIEEKANTQIYQYKGNYLNEFEQLKQMGFPPEVSANVLESCKGDIVETIDTLAKMKI